MFERHISVLKKLKISAFKIEISVFQIDISVF